MAGIVRPRTHDAENSKDVNAQHPPNKEQGDDGHHNVAANHVRNRGGKDAQDWHAAPPTSFHFGP